MVISVGTTCLGRNLTSSKNALLPYGTSSNMPAIELPDNDLFLSQRGSLARNYFENKIDQLNAEYKRLVERANLNELIYTASYNFTPRVGVEYHLYRIDGKVILSLIEPERWDQEFLGSYVFTADSVWKPLAKPD